MTVVEIEPLVTARVPLSELYLHRGSPLKWIQCPCLAFVLRHPDAGVLLVDTGLAADAFERQLDKRGIDADEVDTVLMTHLHLDHTGGMRRLPNARFWISQREWRVAQGRMAAATGYVASHLPAADRVEQVEGDLDVLGDGSIRLVATPGHTPGHMSVVVRTDQGEVLLAGDAAYTLRNVRERRLPLICASADRYRRSLEEIAAFTGPVVPSHDPEAYLSL